MTKPRTTRDSETRMHEMRDIYDIDYANPLAIPPEVMREGYVYHFGRKNVRGEDDYRIPALMGQCWTPVPVERFSKKSLDVMLTDPVAQKYYVHKDLILLERPAEYNVRQTQKLNALTDSKLRSLQGVNNDSSGRPQALNTFGSF